LFWDQLELPFTMKLLKNMKKNNALSDINLHVLHALHGKKKDVVCIKLMALKPIQQQV
jgi:hypothetical protein